jgi:Sec-independent protein secretion pathway component TatC
MCLLYEAGIWAAQAFIRNAKPADEETAAAD